MKRFFYLYYHITYPLFICDILYLYCINNMYLKISRSIKLRISIIYKFHALCNIIIIIYSIVLGKVWFTFNSKHIMNITSFNTYVLQGGIF